MRKVSPWFFISKSMFILAILWLILLTLMINNSNSSIPSWIAGFVSFITATFFPYGRNIAMLPLKREEALRAYLKAEKLVITIFLATILIVLFIRKLFHNIDLSYWELLFSVELAYLLFMVIMYSDHKLAEQFNKGKLLNGVFGIGILLLLALFVCMVGIVEKVLFEGKIAIPSFIAIIGIPICMLLYIFVDRHRYRVRIKAALEYDYAAGYIHQRIKFNLGEYYRIQYKRREREHGCSNCK